MVCGSGNTHTTFGNPADDNKTATADGPQWPDSS